MVVRGLLTLSADRRSLTLAVAVVVRKVQPLAQVKAAAAMERMTTQQQGQELLTPAAAAAAVVMQAAMEEVVEMAVQA
jgi:hypothetical protein